MNRSILGILLVLMVPFQTSCVAPSSSRSVLARPSAALAGLPEGDCQSDKDCMAGQRCARWAGFGGPGIGCVVPCTQPESAAECPDGTACSISDHGPKACSANGLLPARVVREDTLPGRSAKALSVVWSLLVARFGLSWVAEWAEKLDVVVLDRVNRLEVIFINSGFPSDDQRRFSALFILDAASLEPLMRRFPFSADAGVVAPTQP